MDRIRGVILTTQRTGSTFLVECLRSHPEIESAGEILNGLPDDPGPPPYRGPFRQVVKAANIIRRGAWRPAHRLERFYGGGQAKVRVFKVMYNHLARPFVLRYLLNHPEIRVIHLRRLNLLKMHVSTLLMNKRQRLQTTSPVDVIRIPVDPTRAIASMHQARKEYERFEKAFATHPRLHLTYEKLIDRQYLQTDAGSQICKFLGVSQHPMKCELSKLNPDSLREMVTNYDELAEAVSRSEFANVLDQEHSCGT